MLPEPIAEARADPDTRLSLGLGSGVSLPKPQACGGSSPKAKPDLEADGGGWRLAADALAGPMEGEPSLWGKVQKEGKSVPGPLALVPLLRMGTSTQWPGDHR